MLYPSNFRIFKRENKRKKNVKFCSKTKVKKKTNHYSSLSKHLTWEMCKKYQIEVAQLKLSEQPKIRHIPVYSDSSIQEVLKGQKSFCFEKVIEKVK